MGLPWCDAERTEGRGKRAGKAQVEPPASTTTAAAAAAAGGHLAENRALALTGRQTKRAEVMAAGAAVLLRVGRMTGANPAVGRIGCVAACLLWPRVFITDLPLTMHRM